MGRKPKIGNCKLDELKDGLVTIVVGTVFFQKITTRTRKVSLREGANWDPEEF